MFKKRSEKCNQILQILQDEVYSTNKIRVSCDNPKMKYYQFLFGNNYDGLQMGFSEDNIDIIYCKKFPPVNINIKYSTIDKIKELISND